MKANQEFHPEYQTLVGHGFKGSVRQSSQTGAPQAKPTSSSAFLLSLFLPMLASPAMARGARVDNTSLECTLNTERQAPNELIITPRAEVGVGV
jgi:hypothetical protein